MTDLETQLRAYGERIESERSPVELAETTQPDIPFVSQSRASRATEPISRRTIAAAVIVVGAVGLGAWAYASTAAGPNDPMLPPAATTTLPSPTSTITNDPSSTTSEDSTDDEGTAVDQATLNMLHSYVEMRWSGDLDGAMALIADPDLLSDEETRYGHFESASPWYSWMFYTPAEQFPGHEIPGQSALLDSAKVRRGYLLQARTPMVGLVVFEAELGTKLISMDCERGKGPWAPLIVCLAEATNQLHLADTEPFTHVFEFFVVDGRIFGVTSTSYEWVPPNPFRVLDEALRNAWRNACDVVFDEDTGDYVPSYPDETVEAWTELATSCAEFALEHFAVTDSVVYQPSQDIRLNTNNPKGDAGTHSLTLEATADDISADGSARFEWSLGDGRSVTGIGLSEVTARYWDLGRHAPHVIVSNDDGDVRRVELRIVTVQAVGSCWGVSGDPATALNVAAHWGLGSEVIAPPGTEFSTISGDRQSTWASLRVREGEVMRLRTDQAEPVIQSACIDGKRYLGVNRAPRQPTDPGDLYIAEEALILIKP